MHIILVVDESSSMTADWEKTIEGYNSYVDEQRHLNPKAKLTLIQFPHRFDQVLFTALPISAVPRMTKESYSPNGLTPLLRAIDHAIKLGDEIHDETLLVIMTDGQENDSGAGYTKAKTAKELELRQQLGWGVVFLGQGIDAFTDGASIGSYNNSNTRDASDAWRKARGVTVSYAASLDRGDVIKKSLVE